MNGVIRFENIVAIDEIGDEHFAGPHLYAFFRKGWGPFNYIEENVLDNGRKHLDVRLESENRIKYFPDNFPSANSGGKGSK